MTVFTYIAIGIVFPEESFRLKTVTFEILMPQKSFSSLSTVEVCSKRKWIVSAQRSLSAPHTLILFWYVIMDSVSPKAGTVCPLTRITVLMLWLPLWRKIILNGIHSGSWSILAASSTASSWPIIPSQPATPKNSRYGNSLKKWKAYTTYVVRGLASNRFCVGVKMLGHCGLWNAAKNCHTSKMPIVDPSFHTVLGSKL